MPEEFLIRRSPRRRGISFSIDREGRMVVAVPEGVSDAYVRQLLTSRSDVVARLRERFEAHRSRRRSWNFTEGETFPLLGREYPLKLTGRLLFFDGAFLVPAGSPESIKAGVETIYRKVALQILRRKSEERAAAHHLPLKNVGVTGAETRWGSCASSGKINYSWKLLMCAEPEIDYVVCHELAHLREMNHSPRFWAVVETLCPEWKIRRRTLKSMEIDW